MRQFRLPMGRQMKTRRLPSAGQDVHRGRLGSTCYPLLMLDEDLARRLDRLLRGERRCDDLDRLFLGLRERPGACGSVREIGDFVAHRGQREKGPVTERARDILTSFESWLRISVHGGPFTSNEVRKVAEANLRNASQAQLSARLGMTRAVAKSVLAQGFKKLENGRRATPREVRTIDYLGGAFIWNAAFTDESLTNDLVCMLSEAGLLKKADHDRFRGLSAFIALYVVTLMHGSAVLLDSGRADLTAGFANKDNHLEVTARLSVSGQPKPVFATVCMFWTTLKAATHCAPTLLADGACWARPLEIDGDGRLAFLA